MPIPEDPTIKLVFTGLLAFCFTPPSGPAKTRCQVGILRKDSHEFRVRIFKVTADGFREMKDESKKISESILPPPGVAPPSGGFSLPDIVMNVVNPRTEGIALYMNGPFARDESDDPNDFRWIPDIEGPEFHDRSLPVKEGSLKPSFILNNGLFYTALKVPARKVRQGDPVTDLDVAGFTGANIYLDEADSKAILTFGNPTQTVELKKEPGTTYKIHVFNDCPDASPPVISGDFRFYYDAFQVPVISERFNLVGPPSPSGAPDSHRSPCGPAYGGKSSGFN